MIRSLRSSRTKRPPSRHCFALCNDHDAKHFLSVIPESVESDQSPWWGYLTAVYQSPPPLPVALTRFNFFYHRDRTWPEQISWPMATCRRGRATSPRCSTTADCSRWVSLVALRPVAARYFVNILPGVHGSSRASVLFERVDQHSFYRVNATAAHDSSDYRRTINLSEAVLRTDQLLGHQSYGSFEWVEVVRVRDSVATAARIIHPPEGDDDCAPHRPAGTCPHARAAARIPRREPPPRCPHTSQTAAGFGLHGAVASSST